MIVVTGAAGFIGSCLVAGLNEAGYDQLVLSDDFSRADKARNWQQKKYKLAIDRDQFADWLDQHAADVEVVFHLGARTDTTEQDRELFDRLNYHYTQRVWQVCTRHNLPLIYASSAATYGGGELGYSDQHDVVKDLHPLNPYGDSKNQFDIWALQQDETPPRWHGLKFFNVYGPNEYHKGRMASVIFHTFRQIKATGAMKLFRSHRSDFKDGEQSRDFIYVKDVVQMMIWLWQNTAANGLYNIGTGQARTFYDLAANTFVAQDKTPAISFIDTPADIRDTYQYFTEADMSKLRQAGYVAPTYSLEEGIQDYVQSYLMTDKIW